MTEKPIDAIHEDYMKTLKCDCCGKEILSSRVPLCVMNPYEVLCMACFRADYRENAMVIKENANNYRLKSNLENEIQKRMTAHAQIDSLARENHRMNKTIKQSNQRTHKLIDDAYKCAIATDSASAIEILRNLKKDFDEDSDIA